MGTAREWLSVVALAFIFGGLMLFRNGRKRRRSQIEPAFSSLGFLGDAVMGLWFGIVATFHWQAFRWPLILVNVGSIAGFLAVLLIAKQPYAKQVRRDP
jgi:hypothetical protein